jgi:hypothetical protein
MRPAPRVRCGDCGFAWYGATAAHGLRLLGSCPHCAGSLEFLSAEEAPGGETAEERRLSHASPASVLGLPTSWAGR